MPTSSSAIAERPRCRVR